MADDLHKKYIDRRFLALKEDWEVQTFEQDVKKSKPNATSDQIHTALVHCASVNPSNHPRKSILDCVLSRL